MKKLFALAIALLIVGVIGVSVTAQQPNLISAARTRIKTMGAFGNGLAISQTDPMDFELLRVIVAGVEVTTADTEETMRIGILYFGEEKYRLKEAVIGNGSVTANVYDSEDTLVGSISVESYPKGNTEIWAGTLALNDESYNAYIIGAKRVVKAVEKARHIFEYCKNNPERCRAAMRAVGQIICDPAEGTCRERIQTFCENNPDDNRCKNLRIAYCAANLNDADCRAELMERCKQNVNEEVCERLGAVYDKFVEKRPQVIQKVPAWFKTVRERIRSELQPQVDATGGE